MGFLNGIGLLGLLGVPVIIILYMLRPKNKPFEIPSLYLWKYAIDEIESASRIKKLKSSILMVLQIIAVILISLILGGLYLNDTTTSNKVIVVVDCSLTMQAEDVDPNRMEYAKEMATDYIKQLNEGTTISLVALKDTPEIIISKGKNKEDAIKAIKDLEAVDAITEIQVATDTIKAIYEEDTSIVYYGDRSLENATNYQTMGSNYNLSAYNISYTRYPSAQSITALVDVFNHSENTEKVPVSLYVDGQFFSAKQIELEGGEGGKIFFEDIPYETEIIEAEIDTEDILNIDNKATAVIHDPALKKVVLVTNGNVFLEKILKVNDSVEFYQAEAKDIDLLKGYDLYIYDNVMPSQLPTDGAILFYSPEDNDYFSQLGHVEYPVFTTNNHPVISHIEKPEFSTRITSVYEVENKKDIIYNTEFGAAAFSTDIEGTRALVFGFDIHHTDLPLSIEFPIMMVNMMDYLLPKSLIENEGISGGDNVQIKINPNTENAYVIAPDGIKDKIDIGKSRAIYTNTNKAGIYTLVQESKNGSYEEKFVVNVPQIKKEEIKESSETTIIPAGKSTKSLAIFIGIILVIVMLIEWMIYSYRRRRHGIKL